MGKEIRVTYLIRISIILPENFSILDPNYSKGGEDVFNEPTLIKKKKFYLNHNLIKF